jgi:hypothetical protein
MNKSRITARHILFEEEDKETYGKRMVENVVSIGAAAAA